MKVSVARAKIKLSELLKAVEDGETVTICRRGVPVANIVCVDAPKRRGKPKLGTIRDKSSFTTKIGGNRWNSCIRAS